MNSPNTTNPIFKKTFSWLGEVEYKMASTPQEMKSALALVFHEYAKHGLIRKENYKQEIRFSHHHILPETKIFIAQKNGEVILTMTVFIDSPLGLPLDQGYQDEFQTLRDQGRKLAEAGYLAVKSGLFPQEKSLLNKVERMDFVRTIIVMAMQYALYYTDIEDACFVTWPSRKKTLLKFFPIEPMGPVKNFGFDEVHLDPKPAVAYRIDFRKQREAIKNPLQLFNLQNAFFRLTLGSRMPDHLFRTRLKLTPKNFYDLFMERSDILRKLKPNQLNYVVRGANR